MVETVISIRPARLGDEGDIAEVHDEAWREAYRGVIPGRELERMIARRGPPGGAWRSRGARRCWCSNTATSRRRLRQLWPQPRAGARLRRRDLRALSRAGAARAAASAGGCSRRRARISKATATDVRRLGAGRQRARGRLLPPARRPGGAPRARDFRRPGARTRRFRLWLTRFARIRRAPTRRLHDGARISGATT